MKSLIQQTSLETDKEGNKGEEASILSTEGKKKARRFKKEADSEEGEE